MTPADREFLEQVRKELGVYRDDEREMSLASSASTLVDIIDSLESQLAESERKCGLALEALEELQLGHEHNETNPDYRPLSGTRGWCSGCTEKVGLNEDTAREALRQIRGES